MADGALPRWDYRCLMCEDAFSCDEAPSEDAPVVCPSCGSEDVREHWESRVRNAGKTPEGRYEELRDRPG